MKTFSVAKFIEVSRSLGVSEDSIAESCKWWANQCDGMSEETLTEIKICFADEWMVETNETKEEELS